MQLTDLKVGKLARIVKVHPGEKNYRKRLIVMGLIPGTEVVVSRIAPFGDPIELLVRGFALCLRKEEANLLQFEVVD